MVVVLAAGASVGIVAALYGLDVAVSDTACGVRRVASDPVRGQVRCDAWDGSAAVR